MIITDLIIASGGNLVDHLADQKLYHLFGDIYLTKSMLVMSIATFICAVFLIAAARTAKLVPRGLSNLVEPVLLFIRDEVVYKVMNPKTGEKFLPFFWTLFFFILFNNLAGLVPYSATPTGNISTTAALSVVALALIVGVGMMKHGVIGYVASLVPAVPKPLWPMMLVIELIGIFSKHFALAVRLLANMVAGHLVILAFISMIFMFKSLVLGGVLSAAIVGLNILEVFIALLQAYIFTFLAAMFLGEAAEGH